MDYIYYLRVLGHKTQQERSSTFVVWRGDSAVSDPTSTEGRSSFFRQIHRLGRSDRTPSSFREVTPASVIQLILGDDRIFVVRSTALIHRPGRSDRTPSSFGEVIPLSAIQLLLEDDRAFAVRSIALVEAIRLLPSDPSPWSDRTHSSFEEMEAKLYHQRLLKEAKAKLHHQATTY
ncbi:hypothetical protein E5676_scaffold832G001790 [Cucumis melo var. makuwa]|uniref:Uncharacterized protein n=1 Tax=Cucumis melo var. makuwa TaxID=1194695 RepID=A0A5D3CQY0_CUCMM|nr:hypothetical protein E6C27_scaffold379G00040 [Cucumis melo var. makuwa]TYK13975.1 hypothetical protein E5676_scaffold832G001790 [Cucumis melo var. makuwa]